VDVFPDSAIARFKLGLVRARRGEHELALAAFTASIRLDPSDADAHVNRGMTRRRLGDNVGALEDLDAALALNGSNAIALANRALLHLDFGQADSAERDARAAVKAAPRDGMMHLHLGMVLHARRSLPEALEAFHRSLELRPGFANALLGRSLVYEAMGDLPKARADVRAALESRALGPREAEFAEAVARRLGEE
jgi:tetratricopeptide (TPR) repeat protein